MTITVRTEKNLAGLYGAIGGGALLAVLFNLPSLGSGFSVYSLAFGGILLAVGAVIGLILTALSRWELTFAGNSIHARNLLTKKTYVMDELFFDDVIFGYDDEQSDKGYLIVKGFLFHPIPDFTKVRRHILENYRTRIENNP